jgi:AcrR family transcriptional regulator
MPRAFTEREKQLILRRLLTAGRKMFSTQGLKKTTVEGLANAAGISKGAFYIFYPSKEALFMDVVEQAELQFRLELLAAIDLPGSSPRSRLLAVFKRAFALVKTIPILEFLTGSDIDLLFRRIPEGRLQEHLASDRQFFEELIARGKDAGIPIQARPEEISELLYPLVMAVLHDDASTPVRLGGNVDLLLELVAAFCLGEVEVEMRSPDQPAPRRRKAAHE